MSLLFSYSASPLFHFSFIGSLLGLVLLYYIYNSIARASIISRVQHFSFSIAGNFAEKEQFNNSTKELPTQNTHHSEQSEESLRRQKAFNFTNFQLYKLSTLKTFNFQLKKTSSIGNNTLTAPSTSAVVYHCCSTNYSNLILSVSYHDKLPKLFFSQQEKQFNFKKHVIPLKVGIPLAWATTNTSQHFLFSTAVVSHCWDSVYFFQKLRNDGVGQFEDLKMPQFENVFASTKKLSTLRTLQTFNSKKLKTKSQQLNASKKRTLNFQLKTVQQRQKEL